MVSSLLDSCWSSRRNVFLFDARVLACYARLVNLSSVLNSSRPPRDLCSSFRYQSPLSLVFFVSRIGIRKTLTIGRKKEKKEIKKKETRVGRWNLGYFFSTREKDASGEWKNGCGWNERGRTSEEKSRWTFHAEIYAANAESFTRPRTKEENVDRSNSVQSKAKNKRSPWKNLILMYNNALSVAFLCYSKIQRSIFFNLFH